MVCEISFLYIYICICIQVLYFLICVSICAICIDIRLGRFKPLGGAQSRRLVVYSKALRQHSGRPVQPRFFSWLPGLEAKPPSPTDMIVLVVGANARVGKRRLAETEGRTQRQTNKTTHTHTHTHTQTRPVQPRVRMMLRPYCPSAIVVQSMVSRFVILAYLLADLIEIWIPTLVKMAGTAKPFVVGLFGFTTRRDYVFVYSAIS